MTDFPLLTIEQEVKTRGSRGRGAPVKTRRFSTTLLGWVGADSLWDCGSTAKSTRPVWLAYAGSESAVRAFGANLRGGHRAAMRVPGPRRYGYDSDIFQLPKRSGHRWVHQRFGDTAVTVAYLPDLFHLEPDFVGETGRIDFVFMPPTWWLEAQTASLRPELGTDAADAARAALFVAFLDRRTPRPLVSDLRFHLQLYRAALDEPWVTEAERPLERWARKASKLYAFNTGVSGLAAPLTVSVDAATFEQFLTEQTNTFFEEEIRHGASRIPSTGRLLSYPDLAGLQLCLDFEAAGG